MKFLEGYYVEDGLESEMGGFDNELYKLGFLLNSSEWSSKGRYSANKGYQARGPSLSIPILNLF